MTKLSLLSFPAFSGKCNRETLFSVSLMRCKGTCVELMPGPQFMDTCVISGKTLNISGISVVNVICVL